MPRHLPLRVTKYPTDWTWRHAAQVEFSDSEVDSVCDEELTRRMTSRRTRIEVRGGHPSYWSILLAAVTTATSLPYRIRILSNVCTPYATVL